MTPSSDYSFVTVYLLASSASRCRRAYVLPLLFSSSFFFCFRRLISEATERIPTEVGYIFTLWLLWKNRSELPWEFTAHWLGAKHRFFGTDIDFLPNILRQRNMISTIGKKFVNLQGLPYMPLNLVNFDLGTAENGWRVFFRTPLNFRFGRQWQPALPHGR